MSFTIDRGLRARRNSRADATRVGWKQAALKRRGLFPGEKLVIGFDHGHGFVTFRGQRAEIPNPPDVARAYLEFHLVGALIARQIATLPERLQPEAAATPNTR